MSRWTYARIDRVDASVVHCVFCNRPLRSGRLIVLSDQDGKEVYAGKSCAAKHLGPPTEQLLDLSKIALLAILDAKPTPVDKPSVSRAKTERAPAVIGSSLPMDEPTLYLLLRRRYLVGFAGNMTQRLRDICNAQDASGKLADDERRYVERLLFNAEKDNSIYSLANAQRCVGAAYWLRLAIAETKPERREFLEKMLASLCENWRLTAKQLDAVNRWGEGVRRTLPAFPVLYPGLFDAVISPRSNR